MEHTRADQFLAARHRHEWTMKLKSGVRKDGTFLARSFDVILNGGAYISSGFKILLNAVGFSDILCRTSNLLFTGRRVYTNRPPSGPMRSFDHVNLRFADSQHMDQIARDMGTDTVEFLLRNAREKGDVTGAGYILKSCGIKECISKSAHESGWKQKRGKLPKLRGIGIGLGSHTAGFRVGDSDASAAFVRVHEDGSITLLAGTEDHGQGSRTIFAQMVAEVLGVPFERVKVGLLDTESCPPCMGCYGSRGTLQGGRAVLAAAKDARRQIFEGLQEFWEVSAKDLHAADGRIFVAGVPSRSMSFQEAVRVCRGDGKPGPIIGKGVFEPSSERMNIQDGSGNLSLAYGFGAQVIEVEVDPETGDVKVLDVAAANDCGRVLNLLSLNGQSEGSVHMGISHTFYEQIHFDNKGRVLNPSFLNYGMATSLDMTKVKNIWVETEDPEGPFGAKGIGECTLVPTPGAIANAIYDAIGVRIKELPITPEKILAAIENGAKHKEAI
jgi:4-hydroxybenzoyl-CoA reductase subunit alpha